MVLIIICILYYKINECFETTSPVLPTSYVPLTVAEALDANNNKLTNIRYDIMEKQDTLNEITNRLNNLKFNITSLNKTSKYGANGNMIFY